MEEVISNLEAEGKDHKKLLEENKDLKQQLSDAKQDLHFTIKSDNKKVQGLKDENCALEKQATKIKDKLTHETNAKKLRAENKCLKSENKELSKEVEILKNQNKSIRENNSEIQDRNIDEYKKRLASVETEFDSKKEELKAEIDILHNSLATKNNLNSRMSEQVEFFKHENSGITVQTQKLFDEIEEKSNEIKTLRSKLSGNTKNKNKNSSEKITNLEKTIKNLKEQLKLTNQKKNESDLNIETYLKQQNKNLCEQNISLMKDRNYWVEMFQKYFGLFGKEEANLKDFYENVLKFYEAHPNADLTKINEIDSTVKDNNLENKKIHKKYKKYKNMYKKAQKCVDKHKKDLEDVKEENHSAEVILDVHNIEETGPINQEIEAVKSSLDVKKPWTENSIKNLMDAYKSEERLKEYQDLNQQLRDKLTGNNTGSSTILQYQSMSDDSSNNSNNIEKKNKSINKKLEELNIAERIKVNDESLTSDEITQMISRNKDMKTREIGNKDLKAKKKNWKNIEKIIKQQHLEEIEILNGILEEIKNNKLMNETLKNEQKDSHVKVKEALKIFNNNLTQKFHGIIKELSNRIENIQSMKEIANKNRDSVSDLQASIWKRKYEELENSFKDLKEIVSYKTKKERKLLGKEISGHINKLKKLTNKNVKKLVKDLKEVMIFVDESDRVRNVVESADVDKDSEATV